MADTKLMMDAISAEDLAQVSKLLQGSLHVDTPLHPRTKACALHLAVGHPQVLTALLDEHGASIDKSSFDGSTALIYAAMNGCSESVRILCERGANVNAADDDGDGPLYYAEDNGRGGSVRSRDEGADECVRILKSFNAADGDQLGYDLRE
eukprot:CAMPEP_0118935646 /NCGR_PEP_ID=MMETSP1169-20130426/15757_1 /TAXON_ID=36882 /ORGANISM="Pyramimonas obovata, Strain CCMP722" /LENGTH=150 /DNA_ID=CAMNT_0006878705 /DNA_START=91 /DNA_END=542 /DNA_ORIENTATION=+